MRLPRHDYHAYTDGSCDRRTQLGGWGVHLIHSGNTTELFGGAVNTTNNQMELLAAIEALHNIPGKRDILLFSDSKYVVDNTNGSLANWKRNGWTKSDGEPVKNVEFWKELYDLTRWHRTDFRWVRGHADNIGNIRADELARQGRLAVERELS